MQIPWIPSSQYSSIKNIMAESESPGVPLHEWLEESEDTNESGILLDDEEIQEFVQANKAKNTVKKTQSDLRMWLRWCESVGEKRSILNIPSGELDKLLKHFYGKVRSQTGKEYEPETLTGIQRSLD